MVAAPVPGPLRRTRKAEICIYPIPPPHQQRGAIEGGPSLGLPPAGCERTPVEACAPVSQHRKPAFQRPLQSCRTATLRMKCSSDASTGCGISAPIAGCRASSPAGRPVAPRPRLAQCLYPGLSQNLSLHAPSLHRVAKPSPECPFPSGPFHSRPGAGQYVVYLPALCRASPREPVHSCLRSPSPLAQRGQGGHVRGHSVSAQLQPLRPLIPWTQVVTS